MKHKATKQILSLLLAVAMLMGVLPMATIPVFAVEESDIYAKDPNYEHGYFLGGRGYWEGGTWVREVYDWDDMDQVFEKLDSASMVNYGYVTIKLMESLELTSADSDLYDGYFKRYIIPAGLNSVIFDFNGHTLSGTNVDSNSKNFIKMEVREGNHITFTDSVGGGGITFDASYSYTDLDISALYIYTIGKRGEGYNTEDPNSYPAKVTFNDGTYKLIGEFTYIGNDSRLSAPSSYIGTVIADYVDVEINGGTFIADNTSDEEDACELSAFGTIIRNDEENGFPEDKNPEYGTVIPFEETGRTVINGGSFISDGYAFHHFDNCQTYLDNGIYDYYYWHNAYYVYCVGLNSHFHMNYPTINGGYFEGQLGFTGLTLTDSEGDSDLNSRPAFEIIPKTAYFVGVDRDGNKSYDITNWTWDDLHDMQKCTVVSSEFFEFKVTHEGTSNLTKLTRTVKQSDTFEMSWTIPSYLEGEMVCQPMITVTRPNSDIDPQTYAKSKITLDYSEYPNDVNISFGLYVFVEDEDALLQQVAFLRKDFRVDVKRVYTVTDSCLHCYATGDNGWDEIVEGETCAFVILPNDYYELTDPDALEVYVNGEPVTPSENGGYYVSNVTEDLDIYCDGSGFTSYSNLTITANGKTVTEKIFDGGTYTFKTLAEFGVAAPENSTFTGWKIGGKTYQPGETFTVKGTGEIAVNAAFTGLYNVTVENGKAYADEAHTIPISAAAENQVIYIVADPAPEGKVFSYWSRTFAVVGGHGWFGDSEAAVTTFTVYDSDVVLTPVYETLVDEIVIGGMTKPSAGVAIDNSDYSYKWGCSVPADAGYTLGISYWYDITDGEPEFAMNSGDVFQIGHTYRFKARIHLKADHIYPANPEDIAVVLSGIDAEDYQCTINEVGYTSATIYFEFTCEGTAEDVVSVSGSISSYGNPAPVTIELWNIEGTSAAYSTTISGDSTTYSIPNVATGVYELIVSKAGHMPYHYIFAAQGESVTQDAELRLYADINLDGEIDENDYQALVNAVLKDDHEQIGTAEYDDLIHYDLVMDGYLDVLDAAVMALVVNGHRTIEEIYDIKKGDYNYDGEAFTESDIVAMHHILSDIDSSAPTLSTSQKFAADLNCNGEVDEGDLKRLVSIYGEIEGVTCEDNVKVYYSWGNSYSTCTATAMCTLCGKKVATETVNSVKNADGSYTATFTNALLGTKTYSSLQ